MKLLLLTLTNAEGKVPERSDPARRCVGIFKAALCPSTGTASAWRIQPRDPPTLTPAMEKAPRPQTNLLIVFFLGMQGMGGISPAAQVSWKSEENSQNLGVFKI